MKYFIYCDGAIKDGNPGGWGVGGWLIKDEGGTVLEKGARDCGRGPTITNNVAEYTAVLAGLEKLIEFGYWGKDVEIVVRTDSQLVVRQLNGDYGVYAPTLAALNADVEKLVLDLRKIGTSVRFEWIPREQNTEADEMSRTLYPKETT